jgi:hypothetical protein
LFSSFIAVRCTYWLNKQGEAKMQYQIEINTDSDILALRIHRLAIEEAKLASASVTVDSRQYGETLSYEDFSPSNDS